MRLLRWKRPPLRGVIQLLIDGMHPRITQHELAQGHLPNFAALLAHGSARWDVVSVFPTSTPTAVASLVTGAGPDRHGIPGMYWYDRKARLPVYYGERLNIISAHFEHFFQDLVSNMNHRHLSRDVATIFEQVAAHGREAASLNNLFFRAGHRHRAALPVFLKWMPGVRFDVHDVGGPGHLRWGDFVRRGQTDAGFFGEHGPLRQFGISDECTMQAFVEMAALGKIPDYSLLYLPDNDGWSHQHGPAASGVWLRRLDQNLGVIFDVLGGREQALDSYAFVVVADHAQVPVHAGSEAAVDLDELLAGFRRLPIGRLWNGHDLFVAPNGRFAQVYLPNSNLRPAVLAALRSDARIEHILWREGEWFVAWARHAGQVLRFARGRGEKDRFGNEWQWSGDVSVFGAGVESPMETPAFPDAFARIAGALGNPAAGDILATTREGYEFAGNGEVVHTGGGAHGGLSREESLVPLMVSLPGGAVRELPASTTQLAAFILGLWKA